MCIRDSNNLTVAGNLDVTGDITYDETVARNLNITGIATVASGIVSTGDFKIGTATTLSQDNIFTTGIITASGGLDAIGIQSAGINMTVGVITALNFVGSGNTFLYDASTLRQLISLSLVVAVVLSELELIRCSTRMIKRSLRATRLVQARTPWWRGLLRLHLERQSRYHLVANSPSYKYRSNQIQVWH